MTVRELISELIKYNLDAKISIDVDDCKSINDETFNGFSIDTVEPSTVHRPSWCIIKLKDGI